MAFMFNFPTICFLAGMRSAEWPRHCGRAVVVTSKLLGAELLICIDDRAL